MRQQQEERCSGEIFWASSSLSRTLFSLSSILYSWVLHSLLWKVLFWLSICRALWLFLSISLSPTFTVIVLNLFLTPTLALGLSFPFPLPLLSSPQDPPPCLLLPMLFVIKKKKKKRPWIALKSDCGAYVRCICMKGRKEKLDKKEPVLTVSPTPGNP